MIEAVVVVRPKNQVTVPERIMKKLGLDAGDRLVLSVDEETGDVRVRPLPRSYAGVMRGVYGAGEDATGYVRGERAAWDGE